MFSLSQLIASNVYLYHERWIQNKLRWFDEPQNWYGYSPFNVKIIDNDYFDHSFDVKSLSDFISYMTNIKYSNLIGQTPHYNVNGQVYLYFSERFFIHNSFNFDNKMMANQESTTLEHESVGAWTGYLGNSTSNFVFENSYLIIGRANLPFKHFNQSLLINGEIKPSELIHWHYLKRRFGYDWSIISLNKNNISNDLNRILTMHRYSYNTDDFVIGFTEAALFKYETLGGNQLNYIFPSAIIFETEVNQNLANIFWVLDSYYNFSTSLSFFGEFLIDDFSLDQLTPHKIAFQLGFQYDLEKIKIRTNYVRINRWVGSYFDSDLSMIDSSIKIGHSIGPDSQQFEFDLIYIPQENMFFEASFELLNKGEGSIDEAHPVNSTSNYGYHNEKFPSGLDELIMKASLNCELIFRERYLFNINLNNLESNKTTSILSVRRYF